MHHGGFYAEDTCLKNHSIAAGETARNSPSPLPKCVNGDKAITNDLSELSEEKDSLSLDPTADIAASPPLGPQQSTHETGNHSDDNNEDDDADYEFPEGGFQAWLVVFGSFCAMFMVFGVVNSTAALQDYFSNHQLRGYSPGSIGWIFSLNLFLVFFCGLYIGGIFDVHGPRLLVAFGSLALVLSMMLLGFCTEYWQFMLDYAVLGGIGGALLNTPAYASIGHFFQRRRGLATGVACTSGSIGGIVIPVMLQGLIPKIGFAWSTRVIGFLFLLLAVPANLFIVKRLPPSKKASGSLLPDLTAFKDPSFALCSAGMFLMEWGLFVPLTYISSYCTTHGQDPSFGFTAVALLNSGSFFGRWLPGLLADKLGRFNVIIVTILLCAITVLAIWLPAADSRAVIIVFAISFGFASGSNLGLIPVCLSQLCRAEDYGRYFATSYFFASFGTLTSIPIGGQLLTATGGAYWGLIIFAGLAYLGALSCYAPSRVVAIGWNPKTAF